MKHVIFLILAIGFISGCQTNNQLKPVSQVQPGVAKEGTLANEKLITDATNRLKQIPNTNINSDTKILMFVIQQPVGNSGSRSWREMWIVNPGSNSESYLMTFKEVGMGAADFEIKQMGKK